jgi:hypothetical protein
MELSKVNTNQNSTQYDLNLKILEFSQAIEKYHKNPIYNRLQKLVSLLIITSQALTLVAPYKVYDGTSFITVFCIFILAYITTDFINGLAHMYMDNNTNYMCVAGPLIAAFHLHHAKPQYNTRPALKIYFHESGSKFWLLGYLFLLIWLQKSNALPYTLNVGLVFIGILSSLAEVSHYWCHNSQNKLIIILQKYRVLLSKQHHMSHHRLDNTHYAFLNGISDPLINLISHYYYQGYKNHADKHTAAYLRQIHCQKTTR